MPQNHTASHAHHKISSCSHARKSHSITCSQYHKVTQSTYTTQHHMFTCHTVQHALHVPCCRVFKTCSVNSLQQSSGVSCTYLHSHLKHDCTLIYMVMMWGNKTINFEQQTQTGYSIMWQNSVNKFTFTEYESAFQWYNSEMFVLICSLCWIYIIYLSSAGLLATGSHTLHNSLLPLWAALVSPFHAILPIIPGFTLLV